MSFYITCDSRLNKDLYPQNTFSNFINLLSPIDCENESWHIALIFIKISFTSTEIETYNLARIHLSEVSSLQGKDNVSDTCIYQAINNPNNTKYPHLVRNPVYHPLKRAHILNQLHISIRNENLKEAQLSDHCIMTFHLQKNLLPPTKLLRTFSNIQRDIFPNNNPLHFINVISPFFYENTDFNNWEIALESITIDKAIMQKLYDTYDNLDCVSIYVDIIKDQIYGERTSKLLGIYPINKKSMSFDKQLNKIVSTFLYTPYTFMFIPLMTSRLDKIETRLCFEYAKIKPNQHSIKLTAAEKNASCNINFILRKK